MAEVVATTFSNVAGLKDPKAAMKLLDRYVWDGDVQASIQTGSDGKTCLVVCGYDWPTAWRIPDGAERDDFEADQNSDDDFEEFLKEVSRHLAEPLTVQAIGGETFPLSACEWHVRPGESTVEVNGFQHSDQ